MAIERGGLRYEIEVPSTGFASSLREFAQGVRKGRIEWAGLKSEIASTNATTAAGQVNKLAEATDRTARTARRATSQQQRQAKTLDNQRTALRKLANERRKANVEERKAAISAKTGFAQQRRVISQSLARAKAEQRVADVLGRKARQEQLVQAARARGVISDARIRKQLGLQTEREKRLLKVQRDRRNIIDRLRRENAVASSERLQQLKASLIAQRKLNAARVQELANARLTAVGRSDLIGSTGRRGTKGREDPNKDATAFARLAKILNVTDNAANRVGFTFRRLFGILAAFAAVRIIVIGGFLSLVGTFISANAEIEKIELGIKSVLAAVGEVRDANGQLVSGAEALAIAGEEARRQSALLRRDAILTTATYEQLAEAFQIGLGPGLQAGLSVDEVRVFARQISLAAQAIGLEQRQLAEEIRSILAGTIRLNQTRIAAVLGIDNDDIRQAREAGRLFEFLQTEFREFEAAGEEAALTFTGITSNIRDALRLLLATGGTEFFEQLKESLLGVQAALGTFNAETGQATLNPQLLRSAETVGAAFAQVVRDIQQLGANNGIASIQTAAEGIAAAILVISKLITSVTSGVATALNFISEIAQIVAGVGSLIGNFFGFDFDLLGNILETVGLILGLVVGIQTATFLINATLKSVFVITALLRGLYTAIRNTIVAIRLAMAGVAVASSVALSPLSLILIVVAGILALTGKLNDLVGFFARQLDKLSGPLLNGLDKNIRNTLGDAEEGTRGTVTAALQGIAEISEAVGKLDKDIRQLRASNRTALGVVIGGSILGADFNSDNEIAKLLAGFNQIESTTIGALGQLDSEVIRLTKSISGLKKEQGELNEEFDFLADKFPDSVDPAFRRLQLVQKGIIQAERTIRRLDNPDGTGLPGNRSGLPGQDAFNAERGIAERKALEELANEEINLRLELGFEGIEFEDGVLKSVKDEIEGAVGDETFFDVQEKIQDSLIRRKEIQDELNRRQQEILRAEEAINVIVEEQNRLRTQIIDRQTLEARLAFQKLNAEAARERLIRRGIDTDDNSLSLGEFARQAVLARVAGDQATLQRLEAQRKLTVLRAETAVSLQNIDNDVARLRLQRETIRRRVEELRLTQEEVGVTQENTQRISDALILEGQITEQLTQQNSLRRATVDGAAAEASELQFEQLQARIASSGTLIQQLELASFKAFEALPNRFEFVLDTMQSAIQGFASFVSQALSNAFDPSSNASTLQRFAQFLSQLGQQITATLTELAVTALLLNSLSGGILGGVLGSAGIQNPAQGALRSSGFLAFNEGGRVRGADRRRARAHSAHERARGYSHGGHIHEGRPRGLHPKDTIAAWLAQDEWVIRAKQTARLGHDAMQRINEGRFNPGVLRAALGLSGSPRASVALAASKPGLVSGDRVRRGASNASAGSSSGASTAAAVPAIIAPTREAFERFFGGENTQAFLDMVSDLSGSINSALGRP